MQSAVFTGTNEHGILEDIHEGMHVHDVHDKSIGTIDRVFLGESTEQEQEEGTGPASVTRDPAAPQDELSDLLSKAFGKADLPQVVRARLLQNGFLHVKGGGLLPSDHFVMPNQIATVAGDHVNLNVKTDDLIQ